MRKATVELVPHPFLKDLLHDFFEKIEYAEILQMIHLDFDRDIKTAIVRCIMRDGYSPEDLPYPPGIEVMDVLKVDGKEAICLMRGGVPDELRLMFKEFDLELIWDLPTYFTSEKLVYTVIGDQPNLKKFFERIRFLGEIKSISCQRESYQHYDVLSCLTKRQRDILIKAKKGGYYDYPRRINADQLAERLGIGKSATVEHLRKAEGRIISHIFSGY